MCKIKIKCYTCKKRVGLFGYTCRCEKIFCSLHRYSDLHLCTYDYKYNGKEELYKNNPIIIATKVTKI